MDSDIEDASFLNSIPGLERVIFCATNIDFGSMDNRSVGEILNWSCDIQNLSMLKRCSSLKMLNLYRCTYDGMYSENDNFVLQDSTVFSELDSIVDLSITTWQDEKLQIKDLNGLLKMKSLKKCL